MGRKRVELEPGTRKLAMTPGWLDALRPGPKPIEYRDTRQRGLVLRLEVSGLKSWVCRYSVGGRERRFHLGSFPELSLSDARRAAERTRGEAQAGRDPQEQREKGRIGGTVGEALDRWLDSAEARAWRPRTRPTFLSHINLRVRPRLGRLKLADVRRAHVLDLLDGVPGESATRNRCLTVARMFFRWCVERGVLETDPSAGIKKLPESPRPRVLADDEIRQVTRAFDATRWGHYVRLLLLTAVRRDELLSARWADIDHERGVWRIAPEQEKTGRARHGGEGRLVALPTAALRELTRQREANMARGLGASEWVFPTASGNRPHRDAVKPTLNMLRGRRGNGQPASTDKRAKRRVAVIPPDVGLHDLRRTVADRLLHSLSVPAYIVDVGVLGHAKPRLLGVYAPTAPLRDTAAALELWGNELARILGETKARDSETIASHATPRAE